MEYDSKKIAERLSTIEKGGAPKYHEKNKSEGKLFVRERIRKLVDKDSFVEDGAFANSLAAELPADGVVTGLATLFGRPIALLGNDSTVKAGSWGARTVEKMIRIQERAAALEIPLFYLIDSAGARLTDQLEMFPGRRGAGRIFLMQCRLSGVIPQICLLFGPSAAGGAYIPAFCDVVFMVDKNASMYLGSPRMAEMVIGEKVTLEEMGGARMHCTTSGCGDALCENEDDAITQAREYFKYMPQNHKDFPKDFDAKSSSGGNIEKMLPPNPLAAYDMQEVIDAIVDKDSVVHVKKLFAKELITCFARLGGQAVGILANQPKVKGGALFIDSSDKAARFINICDAFNIPLLFLMDVPGFMIGSQIEKQGMIRHGAKMVYAMSNATVPKISVVIRKAFGAGLYAMCGPGFEPDACLALPCASIAVMGAAPAVNAVYYNQMQSMGEDDRKKFFAEKVEEYERDIDIVRLASELIVDEIVPSQELRDNLIKRFSAARGKPRRAYDRTDGIRPV
jgi:acetyl-CoA carboxylase carboxyltransferase component